MKNFLGGGTALPRPHPWPTPSTPLKIGTPHFLEQSYAPVQLVIIIIQWYSCWSCRFRSTWANTQRTWMQLALCVFSMPFEPSASAIKFASTRRRPASSTVKYRRFRRKRRHRSILGHHTVRQCTARLIMRCRLFANYHRCRSNVEMD